MKFSFLKNVQFLTLAFLTFAITLAHAATFSGQDTIYTIQLGTFKNVMNISDFDEVLDAGYPYAERFMDKDEMSVFVSNFSSKNKAEDALSYLQKVGYTDAFISERPLAKGEQVHVVQMASYNSRDHIDWDRLSKTGNMCLLLNQTNVRITSVPYSEKKKAEEKARILRSLGIDGAFVRQVNTLALHKVSSFNTQKEMSPIPAAISVDPNKNKDGIIESSKEKAELLAHIPENYEKNFTEKAPTTINKTDRKSVRSFQQFLKTQNAYPGKIDGKYGKGTANSISQTEDNSPMFKRYQVLQMEMPYQGSAIQLSPLNTVINTIPNDVKKAYSALEKEDSPIAKAYQAYILFIADASANQDKINDIMNTAIQAAYKGFKGDAPFDYTSTYAYKDLEQLILHTRYIQAALNNEPITPCWLFTKHRKEAFAAFSKATEKGISSFNTPQCSGFMEWDNIILLKTIASDLNVNEAALSDADRRVERAYASRRNQLFLIPRALDKNEAEQVEKWNQKLWKALDAKMKKDKFFTKFALPFKLAYHKSWVQLEDYYLQKDFSKAEANALALAVLQATVGMDVDAYMEKKK